MKSNPYFLRVIALTIIFIENVECKSNKKKENKKDGCVQIIGVLKRELLSYSILSFVLKFIAT